MGEMPDFDIPTSGQTWQCSVKHNRLKGKIIVVLPSGLPCSK